MALNNEKSVDFNGMEVECKQLNIGPASTATQITSRATGVTIHATSGRITTDTSSLAAAGEATFTVTNSTVSATSVPVVAIASGTVATTQAFVSAVADGSFAITVANLHASTAETGTLVINFVVINGV